MTSKYFSKFIKIVGRIAAGFSLSVLVLGALALAASSNSVMELGFFPTANDIANSILSTAMTAVLSAISSLLGFCVGVFSWVASPDFLKTRLTDNPFVNSAHQITLNLAYIIVIISVMVIGVSTALKLGSASNYKKSLPILIIVALLLPFSSIFCGLVIDASNMVASFFIGSGFSGGEALSNQSETFSRIIQNDIAGSNFLNNGSVWVKFIFLIIFDFMLIVAVLLYSVLFLMRYIALLIAIILAPLAIAFKALPLKKTSGQFDKWLDQLINWSFVGATASFFFFLGEQMISVISQGNFIAPADGSKIGIMADLLPYTAAIFFIYYGFFQALDSSAAGSDMAISFAKGQTKKFGNATGKRIAAGGKAIGKGATVGVAGAAGRGLLKNKSVGNMLDNLSNRKGESWGQGEDKKTATGWFKRRAADVVRPYDRAIGATAAKLASKRDEIIDQPKKQVEKISSRDIGRSVTTGKKLNDGIVLSALLEDKDKKKKEKAKDELRAMTEPQVKGLVTALLKEGKTDEADTVYRHVMGKFSAEAVGYTAPKDEKTLSKWKEKGYTSHTDRIVKEIDTEDKMKQLSKEFVKSTEGMASMVKDGTGEQIKWAAKSIGKDLVNAYCEGADKLGPDYYAENNPSALVARAGSAARELGFSNWEKDGKVLTEKEIKDMKKTAQAKKPREMEDVMKDLDQEAAKIKENKESLNNFYPARRDNPPPGAATGPRRSDKKPPGISGL
ncbi:MAG: hypothetical protein WC397_02675 [Candidatus Paceibacterota bacterium]|jgi:hypothetical protein